MANEEYSNDEKDNVDTEMDVAEESSNDDEEVETEESAPSRVYLPSVGNDKDEELEYDESAYIFYYAVRTGSPCLSFDIIPDGLGDNRADQFPLSMTLVGGTEVKNRGNNNLLLMKLSNMQKTKTAKSDDESESDSDSDEVTPDLEAVTVRHMGCVNRVKVIFVLTIEFLKSNLELTI
ncbi:glutamate-rich WD repeat-containing protein 1 [Trichonephila clavata]|uniref:Glutamate-rich WD repeat-containing protein 1 n=1 Tax=Trichonephila clavata TaxID=2740835 RepID=A0A8X6EX96_TRICU|nr:glutamate-rich WD repeat-containing protein 1 [Trichonephila clavata]